jgi:hypothetical protein
MLQQPELTAADIEEANRLRNELGYFRSPQTWVRNVQEYPAPADAADRST